MIRRYPPYNQPSARPSGLPDQTTSRWWRPLTNGWGLFGLIIFIGLVLRLIDGLSHWRTKQPVSFSNEQAASVAPAQPDQPSGRSRSREAGVAR
jgi:hypothetical protein